MVGQQLDQEVGHHRLGRPPLVAEDFEEGDVGVQLRDHPVADGEDPGALGGGALLVEQHHRCVLGAIAAVDDAARLLPLEQAQAQPPLDQVAGPGHVVGLEVVEVDRDAESGQGALVSGQHPLPHLLAELSLRLLAPQPALHQPRGCVPLRFLLLGVGPGGGLGRGRAGVFAEGAGAELDEAVPGEAARLRGLALVPFQVAGHRFAHAPADVGDEAAAPHRCPGRFQGAGERLPEGDVAQVPEVEGLVGVGPDQADVVRHALEQVGGLHPRLRAPRQAPLQVPQRLGLEAEEEVRASLFRCGDGGVREEGGDQRLPGRALQPVPLGEPEAEVGFLGFVVPRLHGDAAIERASRGQEAFALPKEPPSHMVFSLLCGDAAACLLAHRSPRFAPVLREP
ncbi:MAG TPA: hypothetical protein VNC16_10760 [Solirubrobacterales bacterium]|nr:hypothetical protein [Solirubrobacterales bacterium]